jgi:ring-1,2-phenylacetyl-CoA epoxidase subunit PaaB
MAEQKKSIDPRVNRIDLPQDEKQFEEGTLFQWQTYEVFQQQERGMQHIHVGSIHAPNPEMALVLAKEQFGRREQCANLWVVKTTDVYATEYEDADMFQHALDKTYRESEGYRVKDTIETFKRDLDRLLGRKRRKR